MSITDFSDLKWDNIAARIKGRSIIPLHIEKDIFNMVVVTYKIFSGGLYKYFSDHFISLLFAVHNHNNCFFSAEAVVSCISDRDFLKKTHIKKPFYLFIIFTINKTAYQTIKNRIIEIQNRMRCV
jgi:hypothetical protein